MRLDSLIAGLPMQLVSGSGGTEIAGIADDSRAVRPGFLFVARPAPDGAPGGLSFVAQALAAGAAAVLAPAGASLAAPVAVELNPGVVFDQSIAGRLANVFYGDPLSKLKVLAVTGTNGKTTCATLTQQLVKGRGIPCGLVGTVAIDCGLGPKPSLLTTPGSVELVACFAEMVKNGCGVCVMEASSHALDQGRVGMVSFAAAAFTNLTGDHLDYHGTMENYAAAKKKLFDGLAPSATAIVNGADAYGECMLADCQAGGQWRAGSLAEQLMGTQRDTSCDRDDLADGPDMPLCFEPSRGELPVWVSYVASVRTTAGTQAVFSGPWGEADAFLPLTGDHNLMNALQAMALAHVVAPVDGASLARQIGGLTAVPGRLELVGPAWPEVFARHDHLPTVLVDYAHTHDAIERVASSLRPLVEHDKGDLILVFGCGGDRDRTKRAKMARAACACADQVIITSDNPRTEDPRAIVDEIFAGVPEEARGRVQVLIDRAEAIADAVKKARPHDTVLICGKGHEDYQIIGKTKHHFDDREQAAAALKARLG